MIHNQSGHELCSILENGILKLHKYVCVFYGLCFLLQYNDVIYYFPWRKISKFNYTLCIHFSNHFEAPHLL